MAYGWLIDRASRRPEQACAVPAALSKRTVAMPEQRKLVPAYILTILVAAIVAKASGITTCGER